MQRNVRDIVALGARRRAYYKKVLGYGPIAYWPAWVESGDECRAYLRANAAEWEPQVT